MKQLFIMIMLLSALTATANDYKDNYREEAIKLEIPEWKFELTNVRNTASTPKIKLGELPDMPSTNAVEGKINLLRSNPGVKPYKFMDDMTFVGVPLFVAGIILKSEKAAFRQNYKDEFHPNTRLLTNFKSSIDDYSQYFGPVMTVGLKAFGYEGRSNWTRFLASAGMSWAIMGAIVNTVKYSAKEMRPDGSTANSWPSGHTANSFVGATVLHKEYGLTRSPWFSVAGYTIATATGVMRILNNRHWISDVMSGAGIGIFSAELGYAIGDLIFKEKGLLRNDLPGNYDNPSFFSINMGIGLGSKDMEFTRDDLKWDSDMDDFDEDYKLNVSFRTATTVDAEGAYFINKYIGIGGRLRVRTMSAKHWNDFSAQANQQNVSVGNDLLGFYQEANHVSRTDPDYLSAQQFVQEATRDLVTDQTITVESDHLSEFSASLGLYFNLPITKRFAIGTKLLAGRSMTQELDLDATYMGNVKDTEYSMVITNNAPELLMFSKFNSTGYDYEATWDYVTLGGNNSTMLSTGVSLTYRYKSNFSWKLFLDYDYSKKSFTLSYDPYRFLYAAAPDLVPLYYNMGTDIDTYEFVREKKMHYWTVGGSFTINF